MSSEQGEHFRKCVSYAVGDIYGVFDYVPHTVLPDGSVRLSREAIELMWRQSHGYAERRNTMQSDATTRDPAITEAMLPEIDRLIWAIDEMLAPPPPKREALIYLSRGTIRRCLAIAERERAERTEANRE